MKPVPLSALQHDVFGQVVLLRLYTLCKFNWLILKSIHHVKNHARRSPGLPQQRKTG